MLWWQWLVIIFAANVVGLTLMAAAVCSSKGTLGDVEGFEFINPLWWYRNYPVNPFGAVMCSLGFTILCPVGAICYWFYKLCTVGGKKK